MTDTPKPAQDLAARLFAHEKLAALAGSRVRFKQAVERRPHFIVPADATGEILPPFLYDGKLVASVKLDSPVEGSEPFEGEVHWTEDIFDDFADQLDLLTPPCDPNSNAPSTDCSRKSATTSTSFEDSSSPQDAASSSGQS